MELRHRVSYSKNTKRTIQNRSENMALVRKINGNKIVSLLIYHSGSPVPEKETRQYSTGQLPHVYTALVMVSKPGLSRLILNILFGLKKPSIPMKAFTGDKKAREWLNQYV